MTASSYLSSMTPSSYLPLALLSLCCSAQDDIQRLLRGDNVNLDLNTFFIGDHPVRSVEDAYSSEAHATAFLGELNSELLQWRRALALANWAYETNITEFNRQELSQTAARYEDWRLRRVQEAKRFQPDLLPGHLGRQLSVFTVTATSSDNRINQRRAELGGIMTAIYSSGRACLSNGSCLALEPDLTNILSQSRDPELLQEAWVGWRAAVGPNIKQHYGEFVELLNLAAVENGYPDYSEFWKKDLFYNSTHLEETVASLSTRVKPLYLQLHAYVRRKLRDFYGSAVVGTDGTIPAHLLGNMWAQHWSSILDIVSPFPEVYAGADVEARLKARVNVTGMFHLAQQFFKSIGMYHMTPTFWKRSMLTKPTGLDVVCHASAFDMFHPGDNRIKMCADVTYDKFRTVHHEMGHIEYFMAYADQPTVFRGGANGAFHEAVGDTISLSALSLTHLTRLGLVDDGQASKVNLKLSEKRERYSRQLKARLNNLLEMALEKVVFLPFGMLVDMWRWQVLRGETTQETYNRKWWQLRLEHQGIRSPVPRSESDFDPGAKYHIPANSAYISYFVSYIQQFQMYKSLCEESSFVGPLHECDFYGSRAAGNKFRRMLSKGFSAPWQSQLQNLTGTAHVTADAILEYFQPLYDWLVEDNSVHGEEPGWGAASINWRDG